jgi:hypothetical protein
MPRVSAFYGIVVVMYFKEHDPPHFHARYAEFDVSIGIDGLEVLRGSFPHNKLALVRRWAHLHRDELHANWNRARRDQPLIAIDPLP